MKKHHMPNEVSLGGIRKGSRQATFMLNTEFKSHEMKKNRLGKAVKHSEYGETPYGQQQPARAYT